MRIIKLVPCLFNRIISLAANDTFHIFDMFLNMGTAQRLCSVFSNIPFDFDLFALFRLSQYYGETYLKFILL